MDGDYCECVRELLYAGASPDGPCLWQDESEVARTPLIAAVTNNSVASLRLLLQAGCRLDTASRTDDGQVTLPSALLATRRCTDVVQRLVLTAASALGLQVCLKLGLGACVGVALPKILWLQWPPKKGNGLILMQQEKKDTWKHGQAPSVRLLPVL